MMKKSTKNLALVAVFAVGISLASCEKCTTCEVTWSGTTSSGDKYCGSSEDVEEHEANVKAGAIAIGGTATCTRK